ncbi:unnamed protein product [Adineta steineri]|uniref:Uncharacterized protein n=1 Tax=Adineta steineri TaxID=433720 RepID=A0A814JK89_9BILA|nr:unnamed protein product [Adineta steineri]CAF0971719.1 unnamed protein product [Adineta steineri]CAF1038815.1 unnamed protein product [Adineta steineri]
MTFYGPAFPNEANTETLAASRQRFGNRSANMFFVRPARHAACPRRLKFMHNIKTGFISYVEDSPYVNRAPHRTTISTSNDLDMDKSNGFGLYNSADAWRQELLELAQQIKSTLTPADEQDQPFRQSRTARLNRNVPKRSSSSASSYNFDSVNDSNASKRLLQRRPSQRSQRPQTSKPKTPNGKADQDQNGGDETQDPGIWLIPILCYILQTDNIFEAQNWLVNAQPTEKRLAMELISRTMQDMQNYEGDFQTDTQNFDLSAPTNPNNVYWPYKLWQKQEKDRQQQQIQTFMKQSKLNSQCSSNADNGDTCERATSPLRMVSPHKRLLTQSTNNSVAPIELTVIERSSTRNSNDRATPTIIVRDSQSRMMDRPTNSERRPSSRLTTARSQYGYDHPSRRGHRIQTSTNYSPNENINPPSPQARGKTPLI